MYADTHLDIQHFLWWNPASWLKPTIIIIIIIIII